MIFERVASSFIARFILGVTAGHLVIGIMVHAYWTTTSNERVLRDYFDYEGVLVFLFFATIQLFFTLGVYRQFSLEQPLGTAWLYLVMASACNFIGTVLKHLLAVNSRINPLYYFPAASTGFTRRLLDSVGTVIGGPIYMILLGAGLYVAIRVYKRFGLLTRLKAVDIVLIGSAMAYTLIVVFGVIRAVHRDPASVTSQQALTWPGDYLLSVLLLQAIMLRRSVANMGWGYVSKVWGAIVIGILITSFCSVMNWITAYGFLSWTQTAFVWYLWYPASAAFAIAPAFQYEAMRTAQARLAKQVDQLGLSAG